MALAFVVEDDHDLGLLFSEALESIGFETLIVCDGGDAMRLLADIVPDVIILDLHLPTIPGTEVLRAVRADPRMQRTNVIVATGNAQLAKEVRAQADLVLLKPVEMMQLRRLAARLQRAL